MSVFRQVIGMCGNDGLLYRSMVCRDQAATPVQSQFRGIIDLWYSKVKRLPVVVKFSPRVATKVVSGTWTYYNSVAVTAKTNRKELFFPGQPSKPTLQKLKKNIVGVVKEGRGHNPVRHHSYNYDHEPLFVLKWVRASRYLSNLAKNNAAAAAYADVLTHNSSISREEFMSQVKHCSWDWLRKARVRFEAIALCIVSQTYNKMVRGRGACWFYIFTDGSPQWRGREMFATTVDAYCDGQIIRRLAPLINLARDNLDHAGKTVGLVWQVFLLVGPDYASVRDFLNRVRSLTTDMGVERLLADMPDFLPDFYAAIDPAFSKHSVAHRSHMFPAAMQVAGWCHMWDL